LNCGRAKRVIVMSIIFDGNTRPMVLGIGL